MSEHLKMLQEQDKEGQEWKSRSEHSTAAASTPTFLLRPSLTSVEPNTRLYRAIEPSTRPLFLGSAALQEARVHSAAGPFSDVVVLKGSERDVVTRASKAEPAVAVPPEASSGGFRGLGALMNASLVRIGVGMKIGKAVTTIDADAGEALLDTRQQVGRNEVKQQAPRVTLHAADACAEEAEGEEAEQSNSIAFGPAPKPTATSELVARMRNGRTHRDFRFGKTASESAHKFQLQS